MHVLLTEASFGDADFLVRHLRDAGGLVSRCHDRAGLCRALAPGSRCPLAEPFAQPALAAAVRARCGAPTAREFGAACLLDCGAALSTVWTVLRVLGREPVVIYPDRPDVAGVVRAGAVRSPTSAEWARYVALRKPAEPGAAPRPVSLAVLGALAAD